jgi:hypothetical protein
MSSLARLHGMFPAEFPQNVWLPEKSLAEAG